VELYSGGAYRTSDLDFVGTLDGEAMRKLEAVGFRRQGRHWIHEEHQLFLEFPGAALGEDETAAIIEVGPYSVLIIGLEELIADRLAAWLYWKSDVDGLNAFRLVEVAGSDVDWKRLRELSLARDIARALEALERLVQQSRDRVPALEELEEWAREALRDSQ